VADSLANLLGLSPAWEWLAYVIAGLVHAVLLLHVVAVGALFFIWLERKVSGRIQDRLGPTRVGGKFGWLQTLADGVKLLTKEDLMPKGADSLLFRLAPYVSFCASFVAYLALPFAGWTDQNGHVSGWVAQPLNVAVFFILAVMGVEVFGVILAGYASASKWSLFGAMREAAQVVSYEVPMGLCVVVPVMICGTMDMVTIGEMQRGWATNWLIFHDPFTFVVFWVYFTCAMASVNRAPFDLAEAESELVAGFHTEYSGIRWSYFFMAEYGSMFAVSGLAAILFFGGWNGPIPLTELVPGLSYQSATDAWSVGGYLGNMLGMLNFVLKCCLGVTFMMWVRWTLPRLRIDQVMTTCLKYCTPLAAMCFLGAAAWLLAFPNGAVLKSNYALVREYWDRPAAASSDADAPEVELPDAPADQPAPEGHAATDRATSDAVSSNLAAAGQGGE
jgi:NADH-quinone oxidoreductase subunit H